MKQRKRILNQSRTSKAIAKNEPKKIVPEKKMVFIINLLIGHWIYSGDTAEKADQLAHLQGYVDDVLNQVKCRCSFTCQDFWKDCWVFSDDR